MVHSLAQCAMDIIVTIPDKTYIFITDSFESQSIGVIKLMNYSRMLDAYSNSEKKAIVEAEDSHAMVLLLFDELIKTLRVFSQNLDPEKGNSEVRSENMSRALTIIYALQSSLDFEQGGEIAENLFRLYEYARQQVISEVRLLKQRVP